MVIIFISFFIHQQEQEMDIRQSEVNNSQDEMYICDQILSQLLSADESKLLEMGDCRDVKNPMDFKIVKKKIANQKYKSANEFAADIRLIFTNCYQYSDQNVDRITKCRELNEIFESTYCNNIYSSHIPKDSETSDRIEEKQESVLSCKAKFPCESCGKNFISKFALKRRNLAIHEKIRRFKCNTCDRTFAAKANLKRHKDAIHAKQNEKEKNNSNNEENEE